LLVRQEEEGEALVHRFKVLHPCVEALDLLAQFVALFTEGVPLGAKSLHARIRVRTCFAGALYLRERNMPDAVALYRAERTVRNPFADCRVGETQQAGGFAG